MNDEAMRTQNDNIVTRDMKEALATELHHSNTLLISLQTFLKDNELDIYQLDQLAPQIAANHQALIANERLKRC